ncbi:MAG: alpha-L-fucosidase [Clostridia bacterium]|nr:alpha-L-fucosidase [Clostridia bacterium]
MIVKQYIKDFEKLGFGMFVHFGLYSILGQGEWTKKNNGIPDEEYEPLIGQFNPSADWAEKLVKTAKNAGCRYITLTTRHHDGFSLYDTCGLNDYDAPHALCGRDIVREFVDACHAHGIVPFFYHTLIDWHEKTYETDFKTYLKYLRDSVEILCSKYGKIGGLWFDGMWEQPNADWEEDALYGLIRSYQPDAMIINNTGMVARGQLGHIELDSVTFERGKPLPINMEDAPKYITSEMCEIFGDHWGYAKDDFNYKSPALMLEELCDCKKYGSNFLLNVGPMADGSLRPIDTAYLELIGNWMNYNGEAIYDPRPTDIQIENKEKDFILKNGNTYYLFCYDLPMVADSNVAMFEEGVYEDNFAFAEKIASVNWLDNGAAVEYEQQNGKVLVKTEPYVYGRNLVVRVAKIVCA